MSIADEIATTFSKITKIAVDKQYEVKPGDSFWEIAKDFPGVSADDIKNANPGIDPQRLQAGQIVIIPEVQQKPEEKSKEPDSLGTIKTQPQEIQTLNQLEQAIREAAQAKGIPTDIFRGLVAAESSGDARATANPNNPAQGALGLTQLSPYARSILGISDPYDIKQNLAGGAAWLKTAYEEAQRLKGIRGAPPSKIWGYALMIYHAGQPAVQAWINAGEPENGHGQVGMKTIKYPKTVLSRRKDPKAFSLHWRSE